ncbi:hypothetical protein [uncultured Pontibacter sp.]|uniref:hypothetical protein n=1 Tax=uncultured Pontibacter sp. TaxID=453356 RepID=UPI00260EDE22|nr:hypothetical protein [uncultured Pontibacter sp.]
MKRIYLLSALLIFLSTAVFAQDVEDLPRPQTSAPVANDAIQQGNWIVGASVANVGHNFKSETFSLDLTPRAGYFISDNAVVGAQTQLGLSIYSGGESFRYGITPFVRYYFPEGASNTGRFFGEAVVGIAGSSDEDSEGDSVFSRVYGISGGYAYFIARNVALEGMLNLIRSNANVDFGGSSTGLSISLGLQIYLPAGN